MCCLDGDEIYNNIIITIDKLQTLNKRWKMVAINTRYFINDLNHVLNKDINFWHYRFFDLSQGQWGKNYGDILWTDPTIPKDQRLIFEITPNQIDMLHLSLLRRSLDDEKTTARIRRQTMRKPGAKNVGSPDVYSYKIPEVLYNKELYELTQNPYIKDLWKR